MNYRKHYNRLIRRARNRTLCGYSERHHIIPRCMGGGDEESNLVRLTPEEHYVAHLLLVKMHPRHSGLVWAAVCMTSPAPKHWGHLRNNKLYGWLRRKCAKTMSMRMTGRVPSKEENEKRSKSLKGRIGPNKGQKLSIAHRVAISEGTSKARKGMKFSIAHRVALSEERLRRPIMIRSLLSKERVSARMKIVWANRTQAERKRIGQKSKSTKSKI